MNLIKVVSGLKINTLKFSPKHEHVPVRQDDVLPVLHHAPVDPGHVARDHLGPLARVLRVQRGVWGQGDEVVTNNVYGHHVIANDWLTCERYQ